MRWWLFRLTKLPTLDVETLIMDFPQLIESIQLATSSSNLETLDPQQQAQLYEACDRLRSQCESPLDKTLRLLYTCHQAIAVRLAVDLKLFDAIANRASEDEDGKVRVGQLSEDVKADPKLDHEVTCAIGYSQATYIRYFLIHAIHYGLYFDVLDVRSSDILLPEYFKEKGWKTPDDIDDSPWNFAAGSKCGYFNYMASKPYYQDAFDTVMASPYRRDEKSWLDFFPVEEKLQVQSPSEVLLVDVGGGRGKDLQTFRERFPDLPGRLVLQDLAHVCGTSDIPGGIETQIHNFFDEQPIKGAKAYYLRTVLHDWPDRQAVMILSRLREAMAPDSSLLIHEKAMPETNIPWMAAIGDMTMMTAFSSLERNKNEWETLLKKAGLEVTQFWKPEGSSGQQQVIIECSIHIAG
ncbi:hypothetical protein N7537_007791 [Penicillium hordei]|uniref:O-methyltransferase C-terminal domain-containing protein n=1 Tax=Penicillium hordei TaxID=40994 RepID=A0AAD6GYY5_9EURO|nr:uncharacterized protein N7537_007791 [Penicillium hordei]KAJ5597707.1 hypothetical protein N7537_007791 [Penicillium hordei]